MRLEELLAEYLPPDDPRSQVPASRVLLTLVRNVLISREPIYGVGEWAQGFAPDVLNLWPGEVVLLHDDRLGICLDRLFAVAGPGLILAVVRQVVREFDVRLDELHNDSTTVTFHGTYDDAEEEGQQGGRPTHAITWGHNKDHRPDLKQLLYILTVSDDGGVPVYFQSASGNVVDDQTHRETWDLLCELTGRKDFLYVADCKLATKDNMNYIAGRGGRFVSVLPGTRKEDTEFRRQLREGQASWRLVREVTEEQGEERVVVDRLSIWRDEQVSAEGYRLLWFHSTRKVDRDRAARARQTRRTLRELRQLRDRLQSPKTRFRQREQVEQAVQKILDEHGHLALREIEERIAGFEFVERTSAQLYVKSLSGAPCCSAGNIFLIGFEPETVLPRFMNGLPTRFAVGSGPVFFNAVLIDIDPGTGAAYSIERISRVLEG